MKKNYLSFVILMCVIISSYAQKVVKVNPLFIPSSGAVTIGIKGHNTFFLTHPVNSVRLTQPHNSDGSVFISTTETVINDDSITATFNITTPVHGGYYDVTVYASAITINTKKDGVYMTGIEPRRIHASSPNFGIANTALTAQITGAQMHFLTSTGFPMIGYVNLISEIDNSSILQSSVTYIDSNKADIGFNIPYNATNGKYTLNIDLQNMNQTNRPYFFTVVGGVPKRIISVLPHKSTKGDSVNMVVKVIGRNFVTSPAWFADLKSELSQYTININSQHIQTIDSNHVLLKFFVPFGTPEGDYYLTLYGNPQLTKHYAFRVVAPNVNGIVYNDADSNGVMNAGEGGVGGRKVLLLPDSIVAITDASGNFFYYADPGNYTVKYFIDTVYTLTSSPVAYSITVIDTNLSGFNFGIHHTPNFAHTFIVSHQAMRCNNTTYTSWRIINPEDIVHQGKVTLVHSPNLSVTQTSVPPTLTSGDTLIWYYTIPPHQTLICNVQYYGPAAGQTVWYDYTDSIGPHLYHDSQNSVVTCSYDPNDKSVQPAEDAQNPSTLFSEQLTYNINFQNTGTDTAFQVFIEDTIDAMLDLETFEIVGSSHAMVANIDPVNRIVVFMFENIYLPDTNVDEPGSHGFVQYRIKAIQGVPDSTIVTNTAYIYFDFNPAIITNTVSTHFIYTILPQASITTANTTECMLACIDFASTSSNATSWLWSFPGGLPSSSTDENPQEICYLNTGNYDVTLIVSNAFGTDTVTMPSYLTINALPPPPVIYISNDTLYCITDPLYTAYQWYDTLGLISGATNSYYVPPFSGLFGISVYNQEGCEAASAMPIVLKTIDPVKSGISIFPNPVSEKLHIIFGETMNGTTIQIINVFGEKIIEVTDQNSSMSETEIDTRNLSPGIYFIRFQNHDHSFEKRFVKN